MIPRSLGKAGSDTLSGRTSDVMGPPSKAAATRRRWLSNARGLVLHCFDIGSPSRIWSTPCSRVSCQIPRTDAACLWRDFRTRVSFVLNNSFMSRLLENLA